MRCTKKSTSCQEFENSQKHRKSFLPLPWINSLKRLWNFIWYRISQRLRLADYFKQTSVNVLRLVRISFCICDWLLRNLSFLPIKKTCILQFFPCKKSNLFLPSPCKINERELFLFLLNTWNRVLFSSKLKWIAIIISYLDVWWNTIYMTALSNSKAKIFYERHVGLKNRWTWLPIYQW